MSAQLDRMVSLLTEIRDALVHRPVPTALELRGPVDGVKTIIQRTRRKLARLVEAWTDYRGIYLEGIGSWSELTGDESYIVEPRPEGRTDVPDIALDIGDRLHLYRGLGVPREVWLYDGSKLAIWVFTTRGEPRDYVQLARSQILPELPPSLIEECMKQETQHDAAHALRCTLSRG